MKKAIIFLLVCFITAFFTTPLWNTVIEYWFKSSYLPNGTVIFTFCQFRIGDSDLVLLRSNINDGDCPKKGSYNVRAAVTE